MENGLIILLLYAGNELMLNKSILLASVIVAIILCDQLILIFLLLFLPKLVGLEESQKARRK
jgi:hypothetical protein